MNRRCRKSWRGWRLSWRCSGRRLAGRLGWRIAWCDAPGAPGCWRRRASLPPWWRAGSRGDLTAKQKLRARTEAELDALLHGTGRVAIPAAAAPAVSILLVLYNQASLTLACLRSIAAVGDIPLEVIIVDNASADQTGALLDRLDGPRIIRNAENRHFLHATNQAAAEARGDAILLLNNDAVLRSGGVGRGARRARGRARASARSAGMIVLPDGTLQGGRQHHLAGRVLPRLWPRPVSERGRVPVRPRRGLLLWRLPAGAAGAVRGVGRFRYRLRPGLLRGDRFLHAAAGGRASHPSIIRSAAIDHYEFASSTFDDGGGARAAEAQPSAFRRPPSHHAPGRPSAAGQRAAAGADARQLQGAGCWWSRTGCPIRRWARGIPGPLPCCWRWCRRGWFVTLYPLLFPEGQWEKVYAAFPRQIEVMLGRRGGPARRVPEGARRLLRHHHRQSPAQHAHLSRQGRRRGRAGA